MVDDPELLELVELEVRELLDQVRISWRRHSGDLRAALLKAMECGCGKAECEVCKSIAELMEAVDNLYSGAEARH